MPRGILACALCSISRAEQGEGRTLAACSLRLFLHHPITPRSQVGGAQNRTQSPAVTKPLGQYNSPQAMYSEVSLRVYPSVGRVYGSGASCSLRRTRYRRCSTPRPASSPTESRGESG